MSTLVRSTNINIRQDWAHSGWYGHRPNINIRYLILNVSQFTWTWNSFRLISLVFRIVWFVSAYIFFFLRSIQLELIYKLISAILFKKTKIHTETYIYPNRHKRSYSFVFQTQLSILVVKNGWNKILKGFVPLIFPFSFRN